MSLGIFATFCLIIIVIYIIYVSDRMSKNVRCEECGSDKLNIKTIRTEKGTSVSTVCITCGEETEDYEYT